MHALVHSNSYVYMWYVTSADYKHVYTQFSAGRSKPPGKFRKQRKCGEGTRTIWGENVMAPFLYRITEANPEGAIIHTILKLKPTQGRGGEGAVIHTILKLKPTQFFGAVD